MINLKIFSNDTEITQEISEYIQNKMSSLEKFLKNNNHKSNIRIEKVSKGHNTGNIFKVEISIITPKKNFGAGAKNEDLFLAINDVKKQVEQKIISYKEKKNDIFKLGARQLKKWFKFGKKKLDEKTEEDF
jgi:ribosomal subunit interface protein